MTTVQMERVRVRVGFENCFAVDRVGLSGGLGILWRDSVDVRVKDDSGIG